MGRLPSYCPYCGCVVPAGARCSCRPQPKRKRKPTANDANRRQREPWRAAYSEAEYQKARQVVIARQRGMCADCGEVCAWFDGKKWRTRELGGEVDHVKMLRHGAGNSPDELALLCRKCHRSADAKRRRG